MKVYAIPGEVPAPQPNYSNYDMAAETAAEAAHQQALIKWAKEAGFNGKNTGRIVRFGVADGQAQYMLVEGKTSFLFHLPYGDAYQYRDVKFLPKKEILARADAEDRLQALFSKKTK